MRFCDKKYLLYNLYCATQYIFFGLSLHIMFKTALITVILTLFIPLLAPNFAYKAALAADGGKTITASQNTLENAEIPQTPLDPLLSGSSTKDIIQDWMNTAQNKLEEQASKASESAQEALKDEINRQAEKQVQSVKNNITEYVKKAVAAIKENIGNIIRQLTEKIRNYFRESK